MAFAATISFWLFLLFSLSATGLGGGATLAPVKRGYEGDIGGEYGWGWGGGGGGGGGGRSGGGGRGWGWGWGGGGGGGGDGWWGWGCRKRVRGGGRGSGEKRHNRYFDKTRLENWNDYRVGQFAQCVVRGRCRGMRLDCPLHCGGPCFYDCRFMCKAHCRRP